MGTVAVYDYDFFNYEHVIPNLECAKLVTYYRKKGEIALLTPKLEPSMYTRFITRKDYDDGYYPKQIFSDNCSYGGRAFTPDGYISLGEAIEKTVPNMEIYEKYIEFFGKTVSDQKQLKRILHCAHLRLAPDSQNIMEDKYLIKNLGDKSTGIILHDYNISAIKGAVDIIKKLQVEKRYIGNPNNVKLLPVGNKFPINIYSPEELNKWLDITVIPNLFLIEYFGIMSNESIYKLVMGNQRMARQLYYNVTYGCSSEQEFLVHWLPKIFVQALFLRRNNIKILLKYTEGFFKTKELENLLKLLNMWLNVKWQEGFMPLKQTLYNYCKRSSMKINKDWAFVNMSVTIQEMREIFQYIRENNYELFKMFYEWDSVIYEGGYLVNEWDRNKKQN